MKRLIIIFIAFLFTLFMANGALAIAECSTETCNEGYKSVCQVEACSGEQEPNTGSYPDGCSTEKQVCCCEPEHELDETLPTVPPNLNWDWVLQLSADETPDLLTGAAIEELDGAELDAGYKFYEGTEYKHYLTKFKSGTFDEFPDGQQLVLKLVGDEPDSIGELWCVYLSREGSTLNLELTKDSNGECDGEDELTILSKNKLDYDGGYLVWADSEFGVAIDPTRDFIDIAFEYDKLGCRIGGIEWRLIKCTICAFATPNWPIYKWCENNACDTCQNIQCLGQCVKWVLDDKYCDNVPEFNSTGAILAALVLVGLGVVAIRKR